jgi:hypothetical protein
MDYQDPIKSLVDGMMQGHQLAWQIKNQRMQQEAQIRAQEREDREAGIQQIMTRMKLLESGARPVDESGLITETRPETTTPGTDLGGGITLPGDTLPGLNTVRKAKSPVTLKGPHGTERYELPTEEEITERRIKHSREGKVPINLGDQIGTAWVDPAKAAEIQQTMLENEQVQTPGGYQEIGGAAAVPRKLLPGVMTVMGSMLNKQTELERSEATINAQNTRSDKDRRARAEIAKMQIQGQDARAKTRAGQAANAAAATENRQASRDQHIADRQEARDIQRDDEPKMFATRQTIREKLSTGKDVNKAGVEYDINPTQRRMYQTQLGSLENEIQGVQLRKARLYKIKAPNADQVERLKKIGADKDGQEIPGGDGHFWQWKDGILYAVR